MNKNTLARIFGLFGFLCPVAGCSTAYDAFVCVTLPRYTSISTDGGNAIDCQTRECKRPQPRDRSPGEALSCLGDVILPNLATNSPSPPRQLSEAEFDQTIRQAQPSTGADTASQREARAADIKNEVNRILPYVMRGLDAHDQATLRGVDIEALPSGGLTTVRFVNPTSTSHGKIQISVRFFTVASLATLIAAQSVALHRDGTDDLILTAKAVAKGLICADSTSCVYPSTSISEADANRLRSDQKFIARFVSSIDEVLAFTIAHELGHAVHGDTWTSNTTNAQIREMEFSADLYAAEALERARLSSYPASNVLGFFGIVEAFRQGNGDLSEEIVFHNVSQSDHPFFACRALHLLPLAEHELEEEPEFIESFKGHESEWADWLKSKKEHRVVFSRYAGPGCPPLEPTLTNR